MCGFSRPKPPPPPPAAPAMPASEVNAISSRKAPEAPQINTKSNVRYSKKRGKSALRIPLQIGVGSSGSGANVP
jgi:hypothetical protein